MSKLKKPQAFKTGQKIGIVALAGPMDVQTVLAGEAYLNKLGYDTLIAPSCFESHGYLAGLNDEDRALDLMMMFADDEIGAVLNMRGGYGSNRLIPYLADFDFSKYPKPFIGYSDITYLHVYLNQCYGLMTYHGPMIKDLLEFNEKTTMSFVQTALETADVCLENVMFMGGKRPASGVLVGGNLSMLCSTLGTSQQLETKGKILFIEEVNEPPYVIDRLMMQLIHSGLLAKCAGVIIGDLGEDFHEENLHVVKKLLKPFDITVATGVKVGHTTPNLTLPMGGDCVLNPYTMQVLIRQ